ncbi:LacI family DNA-binding transcriptional regulator [Pseudarthrobacter enclensis]|uniref:DNA-binding LacI/PurR family transcriptional regulator n=1 Tax=Pseudarthrobacter enclensis TaxID=993070 RepID=A0ABT9S048_9MICC|nr:LacI family DNA-binding transcriptional regulator [Pseudarthrobacter enclensis]MDP9890871.1 DNA-binding LacI/PurR family transcriptional regulator [Pseudarthrobacter enclensis]
MTPRTPGARGKRATILDVAAAAGVSRQTVTRAMNDMTGISRETRERVQKLAVEMGYTPSRFARGLVQGARISVGLAIPDLTNPYFPAFASSVVEAATEREWNVVVDDYGHGSGTPADAAARLSPHVDALIGYLEPDPEGAQELLGRRPVVALDSPGAGTAGGIAFDYHYAAMLALTHLASRGCRKVAYLDSDQGGTPSSRSVAAAAVAPQTGVELTRIEAQPSAAAARSAVAQLAQAGGRPDGILAFNDLMAAGALKALDDFGLSVPGDCAVIGMDGIPMGELLTPELTTMSLDLRGVGRAAVGLLEGLLSGSVQDRSPGAYLTLQHQLVLRQSA